MVSGGHCLAFALRLPHGASILARSQGVVMGIERRSPFGGRRMLSTEASTQAAAHAPSKGSSLLQRLSSFLAGVGVTSLVGYYFLVQDVKRSTESVQAGMSDITKRLEALEKSK
ncbi:Hypothetical protein NocV09_00202890 [Nannochloropsis oceanica]